jgi:hypothetical protein
MSGPVSVKRPNSELMQQRFDLFHSELTWLATNSFAMGVDDPQKTSSMSPCASAAFRSGRADSGV